MKVLLLFPEFYSLVKTIKNGLIRSGYNVKNFDYRQSISNLKNNLNIQSFRLPFSLRDKWEKYYLNIINKLHIENYNNYAPDIVFIYNNEMLLPNTLDIFKKRSKIIFLLGDNPYYTPTNKYFLKLLDYADLILTFDSNLVEQLQLIGLTNVYMEPIVYLDRNNIKPTKKDFDEYGHDLLFIGISYPNTWGYKRALFVNQFADMDIALHGPKMWYRWIEFFPKLKSKFILKGHYSHEKMILLHKCAKIYPVDANPGIINGIHLRIFDCISYGILPIPEYRKDIEIFFKDKGLPIIKNYKNAANLAQYYLDHENERKEIIENLQNFLLTEYSPQKSIKRILQKL